MRVFDISELINEMNTSIIFFIWHNFTFMNFTFCF